MACDDESLLAMEQALSLVATWMLDGGGLLSASDARRRARVAIAKKVDASVRLAQDQGSFHMAVLDWIALRDEKMVTEVATEMGYAVRRANAVEIEDHYDAESRRKRRNNVGRRYQQMSKFKRNPPLVVEWS